MRVEWFAVLRVKPPEKTLLMVSGSSGCVQHQLFLTLAFYDESYRPSLDGEIRWLDVQDDLLSDSGWHPTHWAYPINLPALAG